MPKHGPWNGAKTQDKPASPLGFEGEKARLENKPARPRIAACDGITLFQPIFDQSRLIARDCKTGKPRWSFQANGWIFDHPVVTDTSVFIGSQDKNEYCFDKATGKVTWTFK